VAADTYDGWMVRRPSRHELAQAAGLLEARAAKLGLTNLRRRQGADGDVVAYVAPGRTYFDIAAFELEVEELLGWAPNIVASGAQGASPSESLHATDTHAA
jgi:hypothetical protein